MSLLDLMTKVYVSNCCKKEVCVVHGNEGTSYYLCRACNRPCDLKAGGVHEKEVS